MTRLRWTAAPLLLAATAGCATLQMAAPTDFSEEEEWATDFHRGFLFFRAGSLNFGPFEARGVETGWTNHGITPLHFDWFVEGQGPLAVDCEFSNPSESASVGSVTFSSAEPKRLRCTFADEGELLAFDRLSGDSIFSPREVVGRITTRHATLEIASWDRSVPEPRWPVVVGFVVRHDAKIVAAVQAINSPRIWMAKGLAPEVRDGAALAVSAMLLHVQMHHEGLVR